MSKDRIGIDEIRRLIQSAASEQVTLIANDRVDEAQIHFNQHVLAVLIALTAHLEAREGGD